MLASSKLVTLSKLKRSCNATLLSAVTIMNRLSFVKGSMIDGTTNTSTNALIVWARTAGAITTDICSEAKAARCL